MGKKRPLREMGSKKKDRVESYWLLSLGEKTLRRFKSKESLETYLYENCYEEESDSIQGRLFLFTSPPVGRPYIKTSYALQIAKITDDSFIEED